jgi:predicted ribosomally synthesized peptide with SipW-like signal peptide
MSLMRFTFPKVLATLAALGAVSVLAIGGTYASFTATPVTISSNAFSTGSLTIGRSGTGAIFALENAKIGEEETGSITITNTGTIAGSFTLEGSATGALAPALSLRIYKDADNTAASLLYDGSLAGVSAAPIDLGEFAPATGTHTYYFHVVLPTTGSDEGDNELQGKTAGVSFTWNATQA